MTIPAPPLPPSPNPRVGMNPTSGDEVNYNVGQLLRDFVVLKERVGHYQAWLAGVVLTDEPYNMDADSADVAQERGQRPGYQPGRGGHDLHQPPGRHLVSERRLNERQPAPLVPPDHAYVEPAPGVLTVCWHVVMQDRDGRDVHCNLARRQHPLLEDNLEA